MKLTLRSWGGFTGPAGAVERVVNVDALPEDQRQRWCQLVDQAHVFERPERILLPRPRSWDFNYELTVQDGARTKKIQLHLEAADTALRALVDAIENESETERASP